MLLGPQKFYLNDSQTIETSNIYRNYISILKYNFAVLFIETCITVKVIKRTYLIKDEKSKNVRIDKIRFIPVYSEHVR